MYCIYPACDKVPLYTPYLRLVTDVPTVASMEHGIFSEEYEGLSEIRGTCGKPI